MNARDASVLAAGAALLAPVVTHLCPLSLRAHPRAAGLSLRAQFALRVPVSL